MTRQVEPLSYVVHKEQAKINCRVWGRDGKWITLINGFMRSGSDFKLMANRLSAEGYRVLAVDNRGSGDTEVEGAFRIQDMASDVLSIWDELGVSASHVLGISMGGLIAQLLLRDRADRLLSLSLVSTCRDPNGVLNNNLWPEDMDIIYENLNKYVSESFGQKNSLLIKTMAQMMLRDMQHNHYQQRAALQRKAIESFTPFVHPFEPKCPVTIMHGGEDRIIPVKYAADLEGVMMGAELKIFPHVGHLLLAESSKEFTDEILKRLVVF